MPVDDTLSVCAELLSLHINMAPEFCASRVTVLPHVVVSEPKETAGLLLIVTLIVSVFMQPLMSVTITEYVPEVVAVNV